MTLAERVEATRLRRGGGGGGASPAEKRGTWPQGARPVTAPARRHTPAHSPNPPARLLTTLSLRYPLPPRSVPPAPARVRSPMAGRLGRAGAAAFRRLAGSQAPRPAGLQAGECTVGMRVPPDWSAPVCAASSRKALPAVHDEAP